MTFYECVFDFVFVKSGITTFQFFDRLIHFSNTPTKKKMRQNLIFFPAF